MENIRIKHPITGEIITLVDQYGKITFISDGDIEWSDPGVTMYINTAKGHIAPYGFYFENHKYGVYFVVWTLYPDGRYFEDEDGFGGESCNETTVYAYFDENLKVLIKFQTMDRSAIKENFIKALKMAGKISDQELQNIVETNK